VASSVPEIGQGHVTALTQIVADELGLSLDRIHVDRADTAATPYGTGCFASRGAIAGGGAALRAARELKEKIKRIAALLMECSENDVVLEGGMASIVGVPDKGVSLAEIAKVGHYLTPGPLPSGVQAGLEATAIYDPPPITFANGCHIAVVQLDREVGTVRILRYLVVHDCGRVINPLLVDGQVRGGVAQGIGSALSEELFYDPGGQLLTSTLLDYPLPHATDVPEIESIGLENPGNATEGGFKGIGESGVIGAPAAIANAIADAAPEIASVLTALPITTERLWRLLESARTPKS
jgi:carbon-monoxide dehydrogenase large subunit